MSVLWEILVKVLIYYKFNTTKLTILLKYYKHLTHKNIKHSDELFNWAKEKQLLQKLSLASFDNYSWLKKILDETVNEKRTISMGILYKWLIKSKQGIYAL